MNREIYLAGGCFWGLEKAFEGIGGVVSTECGYVNGDPRFVPDYMLVCSGRYGYREAVKVVYDPELVSLRDLLRCFLFLIDPTQERRQGNDVGIQYQTGVYWTDHDDAQAVREVFGEESPKYPEFHVESGPLTFWSPAEEYHQGYLDRNPEGYCHIPPWKIALLETVLGRKRPFRESRSLFPLCFINPHRFGNHELLQHTLRGA